MKLQTNIPLQPEANQIDYSSKLVLLGSCFSVNIAKKLEYFKFQNLSNPFGIIFNSIALEYLVKRAIKKEYFVEEDVFLHDERWHSFAVHSELSEENRISFLSTLNDQIDLLAGALKVATHLIFTYGTAWVYEQIATGQVVANCHKVSQKKFKKRLLSIEEIEQSIERVQKLLHHFNPQISIIYTVSPVRHTKDGMVENARSKAHLIAATHLSLNKNSSYFPGYEIIIDELRDYRFYNADLIHPNETAIEIIWDKFNSVWIASETLPLQKKIAEIQSGLNHKPFNANSEAHKKFLTNLDHKISEVKKELPFISF